MIIDILGNLSIFLFLITIVPIIVSIKERKPKMVRRKISKETIAIAKRVAIVNIENKGVTRVTIKDIKGVTRVTIKDIKGVTRVTIEDIKRVTRVTIEDIEKLNSGTLNCSCTSPSIEAWAGTTNISDSTNTTAETDDIVLFIIAPNVKVTNAI
jgi:hypothetical protein